MPSSIHEGNIDRALADYAEHIKGIGSSIAGLTGLDLLETIKRRPVLAGPYPKVTLFEAANRIMTDLVLLRGIKWLLANRAFPFRIYAIEYGHSNKNDHDIMAEHKGKALIGEAFNVAPSFYGSKKYKALKKLRSSNVAAEYKLILANEDAVGPGYIPQPGAGEYFLFVDLNSIMCRILHIIYLYY